MADAPEISKLWQNVVGLADDAAKWVNDKIDPEDATRAPPPAEVSPPVTADPSAVDSALEVTNGALSPESIALLSAIRTDVAAEDYESLADTLTAITPEGTTITSNQIDQMFMVLEVPAAVAGPLLQIKLNEGKPESEHVTLTAEDLQILKDIPNATDEQLVRVAAALGGIEEPEIIDKLNTLSRPPTPQEEAAALIVENGASIVTPEETDTMKSQEELDAEFQAALKAQQEYEAQLRERGETPPAEQLNSLVSMLGMVTGQDGNEGGIAGMIGEYTEAGKALRESGRTFEVTPGEMGVFSLLSVLKPNDGGPIQIPESMFLGARDIAITQIVADPSILLEQDFETEEGRLETETLVHLAQNLTPQQRAEFEESLSLFMDGEIDSIKVGDRHIEFKAEDATKMRKEFNDNVGFTLAAAQQDITSTFDGSGLFGMIMGFVMSIAGFVDDFAQNIGLDVNLSGMAQTLMT